MKPAVSVLVVVAAGLALAACGASPSAQPVNQVQRPNWTGQRAPTTSVAPTTPQSAPASKTASVNVGDTLTANGSGGFSVDVTVSQVIDPAQAEKASTKPQSANDRFVGIKIQLDNSGNTEANADARRQFTLTGSNGQQYRSDSHQVQGCTDFTEGKYTIAPGQSVTGCLMYEVPKGVGVTQVQFVPNSFGSNIVGTWTVP